MSISEKQLAANKANAKKSTGPRSVEGKLNSSANSGRHRILANAVVLDNESPHRFSACLSSFLAQHNPQDATENALVERMAVCHWRLLRVWAMESADIRFEKNRQSGAILNEDPPTGTVAAIRSLSDNERHPDPLGRPIGSKATRYSSRFYTALHALNQHRNAKKRVEAVDLLDSKRSASTIEPIFRPVEPIFPGVEPI